MAVTLLMVQQLVAHHHLQGRATRPCRHHQVTRGRRVTRGLLVTQVLLVTLERRVTLVAVVTAVGLVMQQPPPVTHLLHLQACR
jgi:hypothetical protein